MAILGWAQKQSYVVETEKFDFGFAKPATAI